MRATLAYTVAWACVLVLGCASIDRGVPSETEAQPDDSERLRQASIDLLPVTALTIDLTLTQRVTVRWPQGEESFDAVLQKRGSQLLLMGLGPMNSVGFVLTLDDRGVRMDNRSGRDLPFEPARILADVQRAFYPWIESAPECRNCTRRGLQRGIAIVEGIGAEHLDVRSFTIPAHRERGEVVVRYEGWFDDVSIARRVVLENEWNGYQLIIETSSAESLAVP